MDEKFSANRKESSVQTPGQERITGSLKTDMAYLNGILDADANFDIIYRVVEIGGKEACMYLVDGFCKDDMAQKLLQYFMDMKPEDMPQDMHGLSKQFTPYVEVDLEDKYSGLVHSLLSGMTCGSAGTTTVR